MWSGWGNEQNKRDLIREHREIETLAIMMSEREMRNHIINNLLKFLKIYNICNIA